MAIKFGEGYAPIHLTGMTAFRAGLSRARAAMQQSVAQMDAIARQARFGLLLAAGATAGAVKISAGFEQGMARVKALTGATGDSFDSLRTQALTLGRTTVFTARQAADAMSYFALAGFDANKIMQAMPATLNVAAAGQLDVAQAADIAAKIMSGMGLEASELEYTMDVLTKAFTSSNTDLLMLGEAFKYVGPVGKASGKNIEELTAAIMAMSNAGVQGSMAGAALRNILLRLQAQPSEVRKALELLGVEIADDSGKMKHLAQIIDEVKSAMERFTPIQQQSLTAMLAGTRAVAAFSVMLEEGGDSIRAMEAKLEGAAGTAQRIARIQLDTLMGSLKLLWSAIEGVAVKFGQALMPAIRDLTDRLTQFASQLAAGGDQMMDTIMTTAALYTRLSAILIIMPKLTAVVGGLSLALLAFGGGPTAAIFAVAAALSGLVAAFVEAKLRGAEVGDVLADWFADLAGFESKLDAMEKRTRQWADAQKQLADAIKLTREERERLGLEEPEPKKPGEPGAEPEPAVVAEAKAAVKEIEKTIRTTETRLEELRVRRDLLEQEAQTTIGQVRGRLNEASKTMMDWHVKLIRGLTAGIEVVSPELAKGLRAPHEAATREMREKGAFGILAGAMGVAVDPAEVRQLERSLALYRSQLDKARENLRLAQETVAVEEFRGVRTWAMRYFQGVAKEVGGGLRPMLGAAAAGAAAVPAFVTGIRKGMLESRLAELEEQRREVRKAGRGVEFMGVAESWKQIQKSLVDDQLDKERNTLLKKIKEEEEKIREALKNLGASTVSGAP